MAAFGYVAGFYVCLLLLEVWFAFREDMVMMSKTRHGFMAKVYKVLTLVRMMCHRKRSSWTTKLRVFWQ